MQISFCACAKDKPLRNLEDLKSALPHGRCIRLDSLVPAKNL